MNVGGQNNAVYNTSGVMVEDQVSTGSTWGPGTYLALLETDGQIVGRAYVTTMDQHSHILDCN